MSVPSAFDAPSSLSSATTATGSVALRMMPMSQPAQAATAGTERVVTRPRASPCFHGEALQRGSCGRTHRPRTTSGGSTCR
eukprot:7100787-Prymnesium_polylepis.2